MGKHPFMLYSKPLLIRWCRLAFRWWRGHRAQSPTLAQQILWADALAGVGMYRQANAQVQLLLSAPVSRHQQFQLLIIAACAHQGAGQTRQALDDLLAAGKLAKTTGQKAQVLQREGKCRVDLGHWQRAHWCFEHAWLLRRQIGLLQGARRSQKALSALSRRQIQAAKAQCH